MYTVGLPRPESSVILFVSDGNLVGDILAVEKLPASLGLVEAFSINESRARALNSISSIAISKDLLLK